MSNLQELLAQQEALSKQIEEARAAANASVIAQVRSLVQEHGLTVLDVFPKGESAKTKGARKPVAAKYRDSISGKTWTGRGMTPRWMAGKNKEEFLIK